MPEPTTAELVEQTLDDVRHLLALVNPDDVSDVRGPEGQHEGEYRLAQVQERIEAALATLSERLEAAEQEVNRLDKMSTELSTLLRDAERERDEAQMAVEILDERIRGYEESLIPAGQTERLEDLYALDAEEARRGRA